jgi:hypothetical protein
MLTLPSVRLLKRAAGTLKKHLNPVVSREGVVDSEAFRLTTRLLDAFYCAAL